MFYEIVIAPGYSEDGLAHLKGKSKTLRILEAPARAPSGRALRQVAGGGLACACCLCSASSYLQGYREHVVARGCAQQLPGQRD